MFGLPSGPSSLVMLLAIVQSELTDVLKLGNFKWEAILLPHFAAGVDTCS